MNKSHRVLLLDDHPGIRRVLKDYLDRTDTLQVVGDISRGVDLPWALDTYHPDLVILDLELEQRFMMSEAVAQIRESVPEARIVIYSAHSDFQLVTQMLDLGVEGYLLKTDEMSAVVCAIRTIVAGRRVFSPGLTPILADGNWRTNSLDLTERNVLQMLADGLTPRRIGLEMHIAERTAREYAGKAMRKLRARSWSHAIALAMRKKVIR